MAPVGLSPWHPLSPPPHGMPPHRNTRFPGAATPLPAPAGASPAAPRQARRPPPAGCSPRRGRGGGGGGGSAEPSAPCGGAGGRGVRTRRRRLGGAGPGPCPERCGDSRRAAASAFFPPSFLPQPPLPVEAALPGSPGAPGMRRIRANAIAILTVAWILGTFYYLWQDNKPRSAAAGRSAGSGGGSGSARGGQRAGGRLELRREERTIPLIVSARRRPPSIPPCRGGEGCSGEGQGGGGLRFAFGLLCIYFSIRLLSPWQPLQSGERGGQTSGE